MSDETERAGFWMPCGFRFDTDVQVMLHAEHCKMCAEALSAPVRGE